MRECFAYRYGGKVRHESLVSALQIHTPDFVKKMALAQLFNATAAAFEVEVPPLAVFHLKNVSPSTRSSHRPSRAAAARRA